MSLYSITQGGLVNALDSQQIINLLTGNMTDQQVTIANRIRASLTGTTSQSGYVGGTAAGAPASGAHLSGDFATDATGALWICTANGTPGTWVRAGDSLLGVANTWTATQAFAAITGTTGAFTGDVDGATFEATGAAALGSPLSGRFVGAWSTTGAPTGLAGEVNDFGFDGGQFIWICTAAGSPGTWITVSTGTLTNGYASVAVSQGSITTVVDLANLTVTVTVGSGRRIRVSFGCEFNSTNSTDNFSVSLVEGVATLNGATLPIVASGSGGSARGYFSVSTILTPTAGSHTYKLQAIRANGIGTGTMVASATQPAFILAEDIGV